MDKNERVAKELLKVMGKIDDPTDLNEVIDRLANGVEWQNLEILIAIDDDEYVFKDMGFSRIKLMDLFKQAASSIQAKKVRLLTNILEKTYGGED